MPTQDVPYTVSVPGKELYLDVLRLIVSRTTSEPLRNVASEPTQENGELALAFGVQDAEERDATIRVYRRVTHEAQALLRILRTDDELDVKGIEAKAGIPNAGAALQSIAIQLQKEPIFPNGVEDFIEIRRRRGIRYYSISRERAAIIASLA